ncbi:hypothetical protein TELCIR_03425 [Teladorsagia circumcincta]|uniref:Uncharacterized protein n=1 Tax=Teladorsagia circumcincta TaxID=45464 RepID=A0A2G9UYI9_TELCI|nr:hypothetical protein TELCIR_03425 [Teladorsagia circumcincta]
MNRFSPKYVGTYLEGHANQGRDTIMYIDDDNQKHVVKGILRDMLLDKMDPHKVEVFCLGAYT